MKVLIFALFLGLVAARRVSDVVSDERFDFPDILTETEKLWNALEQSESAPGFSAAESKMKTELGRILKDTLDKIVDECKDRAYGIRDLFEKVKDKINDMKEKLRERSQTLGSKARDAVYKLRDIFEKVKDKIGDMKDKLRERSQALGSKAKDAIKIVKEGVKDMIDKILENFRDKKDNFDKQMDEVAKMKVKDLIKQLRERIIEKIQGIREYVKDIAVDNEAVRQLKALLDKMNDSELGNILNNLLDLSGHELRHLKDVFNQLKELAGKTDEALQKKIYDLTSWVQDTWKNGLEKVVERYHKLKSSLLELIAKSKDFSVEAVREALEHLEKYKEDLGDLYGKLVESFKKIIGKF